MKLVYHYNIGSDGNLPPKRERRQMERSYTIVVDNIPSVEEAGRVIVPTMTNGKGTTMIEMSIGVVIVHPNEQFDRKVGLRRAEEAKTPMLVEIKGIGVNNNQMSLLCGLNGLDFVLLVHDGNRPAITKKSADVLVYAVRGDWLELSRKEIS